MARPALSGMASCNVRTTAVCYGVQRMKVGDISYLQVYVLYFPKSEFKHLSVRTFEQNLTASLVELTHCTDKVIIPLTLT